jgi:hypothetical protein
MSSADAALPAGLVSEGGPHVVAIAQRVFTHTFVDAMHPTLVLPIAILVLAAFATPFVRGPRRAEVAIHEEQAAVA